MDVAMPGLRGIEAVRRIVADSDGQVKVLMLSMYADRETICDAFRAGASGYIVKSSAFRELLQALEEVTAGKTYLSPTIADVVIEHFVRGGGQAAADDLLTPRQKQIVQMVAEGYSAKRIASALDINHKTVHALRAQIMAKIRAKSMVDLVKYALRHRLTELQ
jgi:DNA-binding NarL/FixJ family response regulator